MLISQQNIELAGSVSKYGGGAGGLVVVLILAFVCSRFASSKGRGPVFWFVIGFVFPLLSLIVLAVLPRRR